MQGLDAIRNEFFVPAVSGLLNGIESNLRITIEHVESQSKTPPEPPQYKVLSNHIILKVSNLGLPVSLLAFQDESDFNEKLETKKPNRHEVVRLRNNICHGDIHEFYKY